MKNIYSWSFKWFSLLSSAGRGFEEFIEDGFEESCLEFGFSLDLGGRVSYKYDDIGVFVSEEFSDVIELGSVIYYRWYQFRYGVRNPLEIFLNENIAWFREALFYMKCLVDVSDRLDVNTISSLRLLTDIRSKGAVYKVGDLLKQELIIHHDGNVRIVDYLYIGLELFNVVEHGVKLDNVSSVLGEFKKVVNGGLRQYDTRHNGSWELEIVDGDGQVSLLEGSLYDRFTVVSYIDGTLRMAFPGITILGFTHERASIINSVSFKLESVEREIGFDEGFEIDLVNNSVAMKASTGYEVKRDISVALESFMRDFDSFTSINGYDIGSKPVNEDTEVFELCITYEKGPIRFISGSYDRGSLLTFWSLLIKDVMNNIPEFKNTLIACEDKYSVNKQMVGDVMHLKVLGEDETEFSHYLSNDPEVILFDIVIVPKEVGPTMMLVVGIDYYNDRNAPYPLEEMDYITYRIDPSEYED